MSKQLLAIATCRVSSNEQLENNSLTRQRGTVLKAATELGVTILENDWWAGSVSSKRGTNVERKDLKEMIARCKKDKRIKYLIVDEPDRFMRSIDEAAYFEVTFQQLGVKVWYASNPELNNGDLAAKLLKFTKYLSAEGSNEERQRKSIAGQTTALKEGRYPFSPKPGYKRGHERGVQEIELVRGQILKDTLIRIATHQVTPSQGLAELNKSDFVKGRALYKMDKFRKIITDPFYAGIVEINLQVKVRNENGLHEKLITKEQHLELLKIMNSKQKNQSGPRKNGNPSFPCNNIVECDRCIDKRNGRVVGFNHTNGKPNSKVYERYRCRGCHSYMTRDELHGMVAAQFKRNRMTKQGLDDLLEALNTVWKQREGEALQEANRISHMIASLAGAIERAVEATIDPSNADIKDNLLSSIAKKKLEIVGLEDKLEQLRSSANEDKERFLRFAHNFITNMGEHFLEISPENRLRCKQMIFPGGIRLDPNKKVYTPEISILYRLESTKKDFPETEKSFLVRVRGL